MRVLFATQNRGKQAEFKAMLYEVVDSVFPDDIGLADFEVAETGKDFKENAFLKAKAFAEESDLLTVADDSGLSVEALDGLPGVYSHRYFPGSDREKNIALLKKLEGVKDRSAIFSTVLCLYNPKSKQAKYFVGEVSGSIATAIRGEQGFGYDPVFISQGNTQTWAELGSKIKNKNSHRQIALEKLKNYLVLL